METTNRMLKELGRQAEFHESWQTLMRQMEQLLSIAHRRSPVFSDACADVAKAKALLESVGDKLLDAIEK